ncbi:hypothetical protein H2204_001857 [Knufia peltigerae]|uniref:Uncharacterized protein n=1 Tax=Knufia peltigerae TaxID=1002370 RepID=A0AA38YCK2_9EURO|nr:hypothetical protein H2204_001857 [Knufia peltigerae]
MSSPLQQQINVHHDMGLFDEVDTKVGVGDEVITTEVDDEIDQRQSKTTTLLPAPSPPPSLRRRQTLEDELAAVNDGFEPDGSTMIDDDDRIIWEYDVERTEVDLDTNLDSVLTFARTEETEEDAEIERKMESEDEIGGKMESESEGGIHEINHLLPRQHHHHYDHGGDHHHNQNGNDEDETTTIPPPTFLSLNITDLSSWKATHRHLTGLPPTPDTHTAISRHAEFLFTWLDISVLPYIDALERYARHEMIQTDDECSSEF